MALRFLTPVRAALTVVLALGLLAAPLAAEAQQAGRIWRLGLLDYGSPDPARLAWWMAFQDRLRELGYVEGQNVVFQPRWGNGQVSRLEGLALELVTANVDILVTAGNPATRSFALLPACVAMGATFPLTMAAMRRPSLSRPFDRSVRRDSASARGSGGVEPPVLEGVLRDCEGAPAPGRCSAAVAPLCGIADPGVGDPGNPRFVSTRPRISLSAGRALGVSLPREHAADPPRVRLGAGVAASAVGRCRLSRMGTGTDVPPAMGVPFTESVKRRAPLDSPGLVVLVS
jgi:hypothetical protein